MRLDSVTRSRNSDENFATLDSRWVVSVRGLPYPFDEIQSPEAVG